LQRVGAGLHLLALAALWLILLIPFTLYGLIVSAVSSMRPRGL
jgi:hypothetical protein